MTDFHAYQDKVNKEMSEMQRVINRHNKTVGEQRFISYEKFKKQKKLLQRKLLLIKNFKILQQWLWNIIQTKLTDLIREEIENDRKN